MPAVEAQIEVIIEYDGFIAGRELSELIEVLDEALWHEIDSAFMVPPYFYRSRHPYDLPPPLFCITEVKSGSLLLTGLVGGAAATYCFNRFKRGFRRSGFGPSIENLGQGIGDRLARVIDRLNHWAKDYETDAREQGSNIKSVRVRRKRRDERKD